MKPRNWWAILWRWNRPSCLVSDLHLHFMSWSAASSMKKVYIYLTVYVCKTVIWAQLCFCRLGNRSGSCQPAFFFLSELSQCSWVVRMWFLHVCSTFIINLWIYLLLTQAYIYLIKHGDLFLNLDFPSSCFSPLETPFFFSNPGKTSQFSLTSRWEFSAVALQPNLLFAQQQ